MLNGSLLDGEREGRRLAIVYCVSQFLQAEKGAKELGMVKQ